MAEPPDQTPAAGRGDLRASHGDREQVIGALKAAFVQGRLTKDEFDLRVGQAFASRTYADLAVLTADIPAGLAAAQPSQPPWAPGEPRLPRPGLVLTVATVLYSGVWPVAFALPDSGPDHDPHAGVALAGTATLFYVLLVLMVGTQVFANWLDQRSAWQLPRGPAPGAGGQALGLSGVGVGGEDFIAGFEAGDGHCHAAGEQDPGVGGEASAAGSGNPPGDAAQPASGCFAKRSEEFRGFADREDVGAYLEGGVCAFPPAGAVDAGLGGGYAGEVLGLLPQPGTHPAPAATS